MIKVNQSEVMSLVNQICNMESTNCRSLNKASVARELLNLINVPQEATIEEIPQDWDSQVSIGFLLPNDNNYYSLDCGIGKNGFYFELSIIGILNGNEFDFFDIFKVIDINYFTSYEIIESKAIKINRSLSHEYVSCLPQDIESIIMSAVSKEVSTLLLSDIEKQEAIENANNSKVCELTDTIEIEFI